MIMWIPVWRIVPHPMNSNVMPQAAMQKLARHLKRTSRYEPLVVRMLSQATAASSAAAAAHDSAPPTPPAAGAEIAELPAAAARPDDEALAPDDDSRYQLLNGHHRLEVLRKLGHRVVRCDVWTVNDDEALLLLATLNRLQGADDPMKRGQLLAALTTAHAGRQEALLNLSRELPEDRAALDRALSLARNPLPVPLSPATVSAGLRQAVTFFLEETELATLNRALRRTTPAVADQPAIVDRGKKRAQALLRLAESYLEFVEGEA